MARFQHILVPVDFSPLSELAADHARSLADLSGAAVDCLHVVRLERMMVVHPESATTEIPGAQAQVQDARRALARFAESRFPDVPTRTAVRCGEPATEIVHHAREAGCDLIVMGTHADGVLRRLVFGSVSKQVLESSPCGVLLIPLATADAC